jgi:hypothetical protein
MQSTRNIATHVLPSSGRKRLPGRKPRQTALADRQHFHRRTSMKANDVLELSTHNALRNECRTKEQRKLFDRRIDDALDALANASTYRGRSKKLYLQLAQIYCELATLAPRARTSRPMTTVLANGNGAANGAVASHQA